MAQELLPASMLDALEVDEQVALLTHLRTCRSCRAEADSLQPVVSALGMSAPDAGKPSPNVKLRLMSQISETARPRTVPSQQRRWVFRPIAALVPAAIALIMIIGLGAAVVSLQSQVAQQQATLARIQQVQESLRQFMLTANIQPVPVQLGGTAATATAVLYTSDSRVAMAVTGLPTLEGESVYQCWWINTKTGEVVPGSTFKVDANGAGVWAWQMPDSSDYNQMTITKENRPGAAKPEGPVILTGQF